MRCWERRCRGPRVGGATLTRAGSLTMLRRRVFLMRCRERCSCQEDDGGVLWRCLRQGSWVEK